MIRGMATGQVGASNAPAMLKKELAVGILNGLVFSVVIAAVAIFWYQDIGLGVVMGAAIIINLLAGAAAGAIIPVVLKRLSIDPSLFVPEDREAVEDLVVAAIKTAQERAAEMAQAEMAKAAEGLPLPPGMKLPF